MDKKVYKPLILKEIRHSRGRYEVPDVAISFNRLLSQSKYRLNILFLTFRQAGGSEKRDCHNLLCRLRNDGYHRFHWINKVFMLN
jgi:hypothetical protein